MFRSVYCSSSSYLVVVLAGVFLRFSFALEVVPSSSCTSLCLENPQSPSPPSTFGYEITCDESQYNTTTNGTKFKGCVDCELNSAVVDKATGQTDLGWALYNLRYAIDWCVYGYPNSNNNNVPPNPCDGSCSSIQDTLKGNMSQPGQNTPYGYCQDGTFMADVDLCSACYSLLPNQSYYANFLRVLKAGCHQQPQPGALLGISGSIFSSNPVVSTDTSTSSKSSGQSGLSTGAKVGIGLGVPAAVLILVLVIGCWFQRKKDRRNGHHRMNERWGDKSITSPVPGWTQYSPGTKRTVPPRGVVDNYYQPQYAFEASDYDERARHHDKFVLQDIPLPRQKPPPPAVRIDTRNLRRQRDRNDPSPQSLFD